MPLHKRKPFPLADPPKDLDPNELVYQIRFTKEIFRDYQEYLNRLNLYRQRLWTCKVTGKINLTYEEALVSEHNATERVQQFPGELVPHVLNMIQYSGNLWRDLGYSNHNIFLGVNITSLDFESGTLNLTDLINEIHTNLQKNLYEGIELHAKKGESVCACKIIEVMKDREVTRCKVGWLDKERQVSDTSLVNAEDLVRKKPPFSRSILKAFIRESTCRTSPWLVHDKLAKKHGILTDKLTGQNGVFDIGRDRMKGGTKNKLDKQNFRPSQKKRKTENGHVSENQVEEPIIYPIDDLLVKPSADDPNFTDRPSPSTYFHVPMNCVGELLMVWNFFTSFGRLLHLWPFSLEDFENAIGHKDSELMLILESHSAILKFLIKDGGDYFIAIQNKRKKLKVKLTNWANYLCHFLEMNNKPELSDHIPIIKRGHYGLLDIRVKLGILRELVSEALMTSAIRDKLDDCIEQKKVLLARKREEVKIKKEKYIQKEGEDHTKEMNQERMLVNGKRNYVNSIIGNAPKYQNGDLKANGKVQSAYRKLIMENDELPGRIENKDEGNQDNISINEQQREHLDREIEKLSIRTNCIGKDRNYNRYWFFRREGRLFVESLDSRKWGYYSSKEELDALLGSLNEKGERERDLKRQLEKYYVKISTALQKRSKDIAQKFLIDGSELRRSTRVRSQARRSSPAMAFHQYINRWKEKTNLSKRHNRRGHGVNLIFLEAASP